MKFLRPVKGRTRRDRLYNEDVRKELNKFNIFNIQGRIEENKDTRIAKERQSLIEEEEEQMGRIYGVVALF